MDPKGGTVFLLLVCYTVLATSVNIKGKSNIQATKEIPRQLVKKCMRMEKGQPDIDQLATALGSDVSAAERNSDSPSTALLSMFAKVVKSVSNDPPESSFLEKMESRPLDYADLPKLIPKIQSNVSEPTKCSAIAVIAEAAWDAVTNEKNVENMDSEKFELLLSAAKNIKENLPKRLKFPKNLSVENMKKLMKMLREFASQEALSKKQGAQVFTFVMEYTKEKVLKCSSTSDKCDKLNKMATMFAIKQLGPFLIWMSARDVDRLSEDGLCEFLKTGQFEQIMGRRRLNPSLSKKLLSKFESCPGFLRNLDKLGKVGCYYDSTKLTENQTKILYETSQCSRREKNDKIQQLSEKEVVAWLKNPKDKLSRKQKRELVIQYLGDNKCPRLSAEQLKDLQPAAAVVPRCVLKKMVRTIRCDFEVLRNMSKDLAETSAVTILNEQCSQLRPAEAMDSLPDTILRALPVKHLEKLEVNWNKAINVPWRVGQALQLFPKMKSKFEKWFRNPGSLILGVTCETIENTKDEDVWDMSQGLTDPPHLLSKVQAMCVTQTLSAFLESQKPNYFEKMTAEELDRIPTGLLIHLPPEKIKNLQPSVCSVFLAKMENANLSTLPELSPSRSALMNRSLMCLGKDLSRVSVENMTMLGMLLCEVPPSYLERLKKQVLTECLRIMASCSFIPEKHKKGVVKLVTGTFGNPRDWKETTMEEIGTLPFLDESTEPSLPETPWVLDVFRFLTKNMRKQTDVFKKILFRLVISQHESKSSSTPARKEREVSENRRGNGNNGSGGGVGNNSSSNTSTNANVSSVVPTPELIQQLTDKDTNTNTNDQWTPQQLEKMSLITFKRTVDILGEVTSYSPEQLAVLCKKAVEAWGDAQSMNESQVAQLGCIAQCFTKDKLMMMDFSQSSLADIASCGWTKTQLSAVWKGASNYNNLSAEMLDASDMLAMGRFICGLNSTEIQQLNTTAFTDVVASINKVGCSAEVAKHFKAHLKDAFGDPGSWTQVEVSELGTFVAALNATEFSTLKSPVLSSLSPESIPLFSPLHFSKLTPAQLLSLGPDNAAKVTNAQKAGLSASQLSALNRAIEGSRDQEDSSQAAQVKGTIINLLVIFVLGFVLL